MTNVPIKALAEAFVARADQLGLTWRLRPATIAKPAADGSLRGIYDGDTEPLPLTSLVGPLLAGARVQCLITPPAGNHVVGFVSGPSHPLGTIAHIERATSSTAAAGAQGVLRLDDVPVLLGRRYTVRTGAVLLFSNVAGDSASARLSYTTDGSTPTTGSPLLDIWNGAAIPNAGNGVGGTLEVDYVPTVDHNLSVLLYSLRLTGTGNVSLFASADKKTELIIEDKGYATVTAGAGTVI